MKERNHKRINIALIITLVALWIGGIATGLSYWVFEDGLSKSLPLGANVISDDIRENYQVTGGTSSNDNAFKVAGDNYASPYTYKLLGGYNSDTSVNYNWDAIDSSRTFKEVNFVEGDSVTKNTIYQSYGRLFYIDMVYFGSKTGQSTDNYNVTPSLTGTFDGISLSSFKLNVKQSGYSIARYPTDESTSLTDKNNTNNWINVIGQKDYFQYKIKNNVYGYTSMQAEDSASEIYSWFGKNVVAEINTQLKWHYLDFFYDQGRVDGDDKDSDDYISTFNADKDMNKTSGNFYISDPGGDSITQDQWEDTLSGAMRRKFFSNKKDYGYYNVLLFIPFQRNYNQTNTWTDGIGRYTATGWTENKDMPGKWTQAEEDFGFVALYPASKSLDSSIQNFMKIIDYSDISAKDIEYENATIPTVYNGGFKHDSEGYIDYEQNFVDNGSLFIDTLNLTDPTVDKKAYRRVFGISNNFEEGGYGDPTYNSSTRSSDAYSLGSVIENVYYYYDRTDFGQDEDYTKSKTELQVSSVTELTTITDHFGNVTNLKLIDHLTLEEVDFTKTTKWDNDAGLRVETDDSGIYYDKSMILLLVQEDVNPKEIII